LRDGTYAIEDFEERKNVLLRKSIKKTDNAQIIAANIDQALCIQSIKRPTPKEGFIDSFLVTCEAYEVKPIIFFSKTDLAKEKI
jgi:Predicted GTPases